MPDLKAILLSDLTDQQKLAVSSSKRLTLVVAGAGSGKTEVMARRVAWWIAVDRAYLAQFKLSCPFRAMT
jgi:DNA helicase-2/ATP-dependent DNA helicase PcrA